MKIIGLIGEPAAGKSTVFRNLIATLESVGEAKKEGLVGYTEYAKEKVFVAGYYDEQVFSGTDRLSKGCGPKYREWLLEKANDPQYADWKFYFEGERFSNSKFFDFFFQIYPSEVTVYFLDADENTLSERNKARSNQNDSWRKGMATRMSNLRKNYPVNVVEQGFTLS